MTTVEKPTCKLCGYTPPSWPTGPHREGEKLVGGWAEELTQHLLKCHPQAAAEWEQQIAPMIRANQAAVIEELFRRHPNEMTLYHPQTGDGQHRGHP
jgi:hypothetical protein